MLRRIVVARMLDDALADSESQVKSTEGSVSLLKPGHDAQRVQIVIEPETVGAQGVIQRFFAGVTEGRMADVVHQRERFRQIGVQA